MTAALESGSSQYHGKVQKHMIVFENAKANTRYYKEEFSPSWKGPRVC